MTSSQKFHSKNVESSTSKTTPFQTRYKSSYGKTQVHLSFAKGHVIPSEQKSFSKTRVGLATMTGGQWLPKGKQFTYFIIIPNGSGHQDRPRLIFHEWQKEEKRLDSNTFHLKPTFTDCAAH